MSKKKTRRESGVEGSLAMVVVVVMEPMICLCMRVLVRICVKLVILMLMSIVAVYELSKLLSMNLLTMANLCSRESSW